MTLICRAFNFLFPPYCKICGKQSRKELCDNCYLRFKKYEDLHIINFKKDDIPFKLKYQFERRNLDYLIYLFNYKKSIRKLILNYKFFNQFYLSKVFSEIIFKNEKLCRILKFYDIIIPVPMHKNKLKVRGYNQAELLAIDLCEKLNFKYYKNILIKTVNNKKQSSLSEKERYENIKNVYKILKPEKIKNKNIILVDDICTTSATLEECAKILKKNGARKVTAVVIAKD
ncbi:MAG: ComF family protein [Clostridia bacterium]|nr:ComF family protein [Clostridia bacterium]